MKPLDLDHLRRWIGSSMEAEDIVTPGLAQRLAATLDLPVEIRPGDAAPVGLHWCLAPPVAQTSTLGADGHPERGGFLPPVPMPRRMWAGGEVALLRPLRVGDTVRRVSRVQDVTAKTGSTGPLCFVVVKHEYDVGGETAISERQDIVFRELDAAARPAAAKAVTAPEAQASQILVADAPLLFRYSALTFNGHRIHYDRRYCLEEEHYPGLVVHGPLQATLLLHLASSRRGHAAPSRFSFRGLAPLFEGPFSINAAEDRETVKLWSADPTGSTTMAAEARWD